MKENLRTSCPVCGSPFGRNGSCPGCGFDIGLWYEQYATLSPLKERTSLRSRQTQWQKKNGNRLRCPDCGGELFAVLLDESSLRCEGCGHVLSQLALRKLLGSKGSGTAKRTEPDTMWRSDLAMVAITVRSSRRLVTGYTGSVPFLELPEGIDGIDSHAFEGHAGLQGVRLPAGLSSIGEAAFSGCSSLREIRIPEGVTILRENTFARCFQLEKVTLPEGLIRIEEHAFYCCSSLRELRIPDSVKEISPDAFQWTHLTLSASADWIRRNRKTMEDAQVFCKSL